MARIGRPPLGLRSPDPQSSGSGWTIAASRPRIGHRRQHALYPPHPPRPSVLHGCSCGSSGARMMDSRILVFPNFFCFPGAKTPSGHAGSRGSLSIDAHGLNSAHRARAPPIQARQPFYVH